MQANNIRKYLMNAIDFVVAHIEEYVILPGHDLTRRRKLPAGVLILHLLTMGAGSIGTEIKKFFGSLSATPMVSAVCQQRAKLKPEALRKVFQLFLDELYNRGRPPKWQFVAVDGTRFTFPDRNRDNSANDEWRHREGKKPLEGHMTAAWDICRRLFLDAVVQPLHKINEYAAICQMIDRFQARKGCRVVFIADRGFPSWNVVAHAEKNGHFFVIRTKDRNVSLTILKQLPLPDTEEFDVSVNIRLIRQPRLKEQAHPDQTAICLRSNVHFDYISPGSEEVFDLTLRVVRYALPSGGFASVITNLPVRWFSTRQIIDLYAKRWTEETAFGELKGALAMESFHTTKPELIEQELWAKLTAFNAVSAIHHAAQILTDQRAREKRKAGQSCRHRYQVDFTAACTAVMRFLVPGSADYDDPDFQQALSRRTHAVRKKRPHPPRGRVRRRTPVPSTHRAAA